MIRAEDKLWTAKILDKASASKKNKSVEYSDFMDPYRKRIVDGVLSGVIGLNYCFHGGYCGAEREITVLSPSFSVLDESGIAEILNVIRINTAGRENLTHRDYLGSIMGLGIKREKIGDILVGEEYTDVIVLSTVAGYIQYNLNKVANAKVQVDTVSLNEINVPEPKVKHINTTVTSLRLDSVSSAGFGMSRSKVAELIKAERIYLNWEETDSLTKQVREGDTISLRGRGRVVVEKVGGPTKKGRIGITLKRLI